MVLVYQNGNYDVKNIYFYYPTIWKKLRISIFMTHFRQNWGQKKWWTTNFNWGHVNSTFAGFFRQNMSHEKRTPRLHLKPLHPARLYVKLVAMTLNTFDGAEGSQYLELNCSVRPPQIARFGELGLWHPYANPVIEVRLFPVGLNRRSEIALNSRSFPGSIHTKAVPFCGNF